MLGLALSFAFKHWRWIAGAVLAIAAVGLYQQQLAKAREQGRAETLAKWDAERAAHAAVAAKASEAARLEEQRRLAAQQEVQREAQLQAEAARADAATARAARDRLRVQLAAIVGRGGAANDTAAASGGPPTGDPIGVLADVLDRADERAGDLAAYADAARVAGAACERAYDALTMSP